jgi:protoporphyrinogen/coproporphyrinogen III oxidase
VSQLYDLIVVGGGISGLTAAYRGVSRGWSTLLLEASQRVGGAIETSRGEGLVQELGAESMVTAKPQGKQLCQELGLGDQLVTPQPEYRTTMIVRNGKLHKIPEGLRLLAPSQWLPFLRSSAVSWPGKMRMGMEFFVPRRHGDGDESLGSFVRRRLGPEALARIAQPLVAGIYTADPETLSMRATLPQFLEYEKRYGSVCRALLFSPEARGASGPRYQLFCSLQGGLQQLTDALGARVPVQTSTPVHSVEHNGSEWRVGEHRSRRLVLAVPTYVAAHLLRSLDATTAEWLARHSYLSSATVNLVYPLAAVERSTRAYGFVVPAVENRDILACTFSHRKYPGRTPDDVALLRAYVGGAARPEAMSWSDEEMARRSHRDLAALLKIQGQPLSATVKRYERAMPLYRVGHLDWVQTLEDQLSRWPTLALIGNAYRGVGIPDCIRGADEAVTRLAAV